MKPSKILRTLALLALAVSPALASAQGEPQEQREALVLTMRDGTEELYFLHETPRLSYNGPQVLIENSLVSATHHMGDVQSASFQMRGLPSSVDQVADSPFSFRYDGAQVWLTGLQPGEEVGVYTLGGLKAASWKADRQGSCSFTTAGLPKEVCVLTTSRKSIKITIR